MNFLPWEDLFCLVVCVTLRHWRMCMVLDSELVVTINCWVSDVVCSGLVEHTLEEIEQGGRYAWIHEVDGSPE